jgi:hypothetical protein
MGCLATHIAWNHPRTARMTLDAGICWLNHVADLNPATSLVIREWDRCADFDYDVRLELARIFRAELDARQETPETAPTNRIAELVEV